LSCAGHAHACPLSSASAWVRRHLAHVAHLQSLFPTCADSFQDALVAPASRALSNLECGLRVWISLGGGVRQRPRTRGTNSTTRCTTSLTWCATVLTRRTAVLIRCTILLTRRTTVLARLTIVLTKSKTVRSRCAIGLIRCPSTSCFKRTVGRTSRLEPISSTFVRLVDVLAES